MQAEPPTMSAATAMAWRSGTVAGCSGRAGRRPWLPGLGHDVHAGQLSGPAGNPGDDFDHVVEVALGTGAAGDGQDGPGPSRPGPAHGRPEQCRRTVLLPARGTDVPAIAKVAFTSEDRGRDVIRDFNADGFRPPVPQRDHDCGGEDDPDRGAGEVVSVCLSLLAGQQPRPTWLPWPR